jgi:hypothetical protein
MSNLDEMFEFENQWFKAVKRRLQFKGDNIDTNTMRCPICDQTMDVSRRSNRMTFAGPEPACIQVYCNTCGVGGELKP